MTNLIDNTSPFLSRLDFNNLSSEDQASVDALIDASSIIIEKACNRHFLEDDYTDEELDGDDLNSLFIKNPPLNSIDNLSIIVDCQVATFDYDTTPFDIVSRTGRIRWKSFNRLVNFTDRYFGYFPKGNNNILVSYNGGFTDVPTPIQKLCADMVLNNFSPGDNPDNIESEKLGQYFVKYKKDSLYSNVLSSADIISLYKIHKV